MRLHRARADARAAAAVRDAEGLVQVEVRDVRAPLAGLGDADQGVHVGAVGVHLAAVRVDDLADLDDVFLEHAVRGRVGDHQRGQARRRTSRPARRMSSTSTLPLASHLVTTTCMPHICAEAGLVPCADSGIRQMSRCVVAARAVVGADREQAGVLALRAGVGLQADGVVAGALDQHRLEFVDQLLVAAAPARPARADGCCRTPATSPGSSRRWR